GKVGSVQFANLPDGWIAVQNISEEGEIRFALAGSTPVRPGAIADIVIELSGDAEGLSLRGEGNVNGSSYNLGTLEGLKQLPAEFSLSQNYPNPFNPTTNIRYELPATAEVRVDVYNINGQRVRTLVNNEQSAGVHTLNVDMSHFASGVYLYRIQAVSAEETFTSTRKMILIK
ncbi:T9SS type A sorting domain-containing protein, partial [Balneolaceae bacterium ANBcel3]|nr:T9SS type A sorting domain-containing protein [Balneolaceae bacterium ANBcel3]